MKFLFCFFFVATLARVALPAPADGFVFPDERRERKLEPIITPPVLPVLEHLERDPSTLINEPAKRTFPSPVKPRFFGGGFNVAPSGNGGLTASISSSGSAGSASHSVSQSFSFGFNEGFGASQSASQSSSFGFGGWKESPKHGRPHGFPIVWLPLNTKNNFVMPKMRDPVTFKPFVFEPITFKPFKPMTFKPIDVNYVPKDGENFVAVSSSSHSETSNINGVKSSSGGTNDLVNNNGAVKQAAVEFEQGDDPENDDDELVDNK